MFAKKIRFHNFNLLLSFPLTSQFAHFCNLGNKNSNSAGKFINKVGSNKKPKMCKKFFVLSSFLSRVKYNGETLDYISLEHILNVKISQCPCLPILCYYHLIREE